MESFQQAHMDRLRDMDAMELPGHKKMIAQIMSAVIEAVEERIRDGVNDPIVALYEEMNSNLDGTQYHPYDQPPTKETTL